MNQTFTQQFEKQSASGADDRLLWACSSMQGWRRSMEDAHTTILDLLEDESETAPREERISFFGVYDGHGGKRVASYSGRNIHKIVASQASFKAKNYAQGLRDGFLATDRAILQDRSYRGEISGCTATVLLVTSSTVFVANAGDSRAVLGIKGRAKPLSDDHKPELDAEMERIVAAGGFVDVGRVNGILAVSRAIGDFQYKRNPKLPPERQIITAFPDVIQHDITADDEFLVLACDGIWDCVDSQAAVEFVRRGIAAYQPLENICEDLMNQCMSTGIEGIGYDNMTMMVVGLLQGKNEEEWYTMIAARVADGDGSCPPPEYAYKIHNGILFL